jgi:hypothetical protein
MDCLDAGQRDVLGCSAVRPLPLPVPYPDALTDAVGHAGSYGVDIAGAVTVGND